MNDNSNLLNLFLGIDVGTTSVKFLVTDEELNNIYSNDVRYKTNITENQWADINPKVWIELIDQELKSIFSKKFGQNISYIAVTGQMHTTVFLDKKNESVRNAILWNDKRTIGLSLELRRELELGRDSILTNLISPGNPFVNLMWVKKHELENFKKIKKICFCKDYVNLFLTGKVTTDYGDASTSGFFDFDRKTWSVEMCKNNGIDIQVLPEIFEAGYVIGDLTEALKESYKIKNNVKVIVGTGDNAATMYSVYSLYNQKHTISLGTSAVNISLTNQPQENFKNILLKTNNEEHIVIQSSLATGGKAIEWWKSIIEESKILSNSNEFSLGNIIDSEVMFLPYLLGEKYVLKNQNLTGAFIKLTPSTTKNQMTVAILEGIGLGLRLISNQIYLESHKIVAVGGGTKNLLWLNMIANIFNKEIIHGVQDVGAVQGVILIAIRAINGNVCAKLSNQNRIFPDENFVGKYNEKYSGFKIFSEQYSRLCWIE